MNKRAMLLSVFLAFSSIVSLAPSASADHWQNGRRQDRDYRSGSYDRYDRCSANAAARINKDRNLIRQWEGTGRHQKVVRWAYDDMADARRDVATCRAQARNQRYDPYPYDDRNAGYDPYERSGYDPNYGNDPYYGSAGADAGFDWKRDWPLILGGMLNAQVGR